jgi:hypothetical protein
MQPEVLIAKPTINPSAEPVAREQDGKLEASAKARARRHWLGTTGSRRQTIQVAHPSQRSMPACLSHVQSCRGPVDHRIKP